MNSVKYCEACGVKLQTTDPNEVGYVKSLDYDLCVRCFKLKHYGVDTLQNQFESNYDIKPNALVLLVYSMMNLEYLEADSFHKLGSNLDYILIVNQCDLLESTHHNKLYDQLKKVLKTSGIRVLDIIFMSAIHQEDLGRLKAYLKDASYKDIYLYGAQNSGKTTIFNGLTGLNALTGLKLGLTNDVITGNLNPQKQVHDLPGLKREGYLDALLDYQTYKVLIPKTRIRPKVYQMTDKQYLNVHDLFLIKPSSPCSIILYVSDMVEIKRRNITHFRVEADSHMQAYKVSDQSEISLANLGFIHMRGLSHITIIYPKKLRVNLSKRLF